MTVLTFDVGDATSIRSVGVTVCVYVKGKVPGHCTRNLAACPVFVQDGIVVRKMLTSVSVHYPVDTMTFVTSDNLGSRRNGATLTNVRGGDVT